MQESIASDIETIEAELPGAINLQGATHGSTWIVAHDKTKAWLTLCGL